MTLRGRAELSLIAMCLVWGISFVLVKNALADISPALYLALRFSIGGMLLALVARGRGGLRAGVPAGIMFFAGCILQTTGLLWTTPAKSAFLTSMYLVFVPILAALVHKRLPSRTETVGISVAFFGMMLLTLDSEELTAGKGDLLTALCAVAFAGHILILDAVAAGSPIRRLAMIQVLTAAALAWLAVPVVEEPRIRWSAAVIIALTVTSILTTALAIFVQTWAQTHTTATRAALLFMAEPVFAAFSSFLLIGETLSTRAFVGAALILGGIAAIELKPLTRRAHPNP